MDSLYKGYPIGYIITWQNPDVRLKDGTSSNGKTIIIDGQQRITALKAAFDGQEVIDKNYKPTKIIIAFHPIKERFETSTSAIRKNKEWIHDISEVMRIDFNSYGFIQEYLQHNPNVNVETLSQNLQNLTEIKTRTIGELKLTSETPLDIVNEIFTRINKEGAMLSEADFAMSRIATFELEQGDEYGITLRKFFDYFCHGLQTPSIIRTIQENDRTFSKKDEFNKISWLAKSKDLIYKPAYSDVIRTAGIIGLNRARLRDVVALLAGRNFEVRSFSQEDSYQKPIANESFIKFHGTIETMVNEYNYRRFEQDILRGSGFQTSDMFNSMNALNYTFAIYHTLLKQTSDFNKVRQLTRKFLLFTILVEHHSGSFETRWEADFKQFDSVVNAETLLNSYETEQLSEIYWTSTLPRELGKSANIKSPKWNVFVAAQNKLNKKSFLSDVEVKNMQIVDLHHIFPKEFLKSAGKTEKEYNRISNFVILSRDINIKIGKTSPSIYLSDVSKYGSSITKLQDNLKDNCVPHDPELWKVENYDVFLEERTKLISALIREHYESL